MRRSPFLLVLVLLAGCAVPPGEVHIQDIHGMAVDPDNRTRLYVATHHGLFLGQGDERWSAVTAEPFDMMGFTMHPSDPKTMYASGHPSKAGRDWAVGVVKSTDGGVTWKTLGLKNEVDFHAMTMQPGPGGNDIIYGFHGGMIHVSTDGGLTWRSHAVDFDVSGLAVDVRDGTVWAATDQGIRKTAAGAAGSWSVVSSSPASAVAFSPSRAGVVLAYFDDDGLKSSMDAGSSWRGMNWTVPERDYPWAIAPDPKDDHVAYTGTLRGRIFKTVDGGATWTTIR